MENHYALFSTADSRFLEGYLGGRPLCNVLDAYKGAFGSVQVLAFERDSLAAIVRDYLGADEQTKRNFCAALDGCKVSPSESATRETERRLQEKERVFRSEKRGRPWYRETDVAGHLRMIYGI